MAVTPVGNPYVESSDLVANYPGASEALAERIDIVGVNPFADSAARATAIPSPTEGMMSSLNDTDAVQRYDGATWKPVGGKVLQVVTGTTTTEVTSTSATYVDTNLTLAISPSLASSKILVIINQIVRTYDAGAGAVKIVRGSTDIWLPNIAFYLAGDRQVFSMTYLDSPNTTSATTYKTQFARNSGTVVVQPNSSRSQITLMEIGA